MAPGGRKFKAGAPCAGTGRRRARGEAGLAERPGRPCAQRRLAADLPCRNHHQSRGEAMTRLASALLSFGLALLPSVSWAQTTEQRIGVMLLASRQNVLGTAGLDHSSGTITGAEFLVRNEGAGLYGRYLTGEVGTLSARGPDGHLRMADMRILLGPPVFNIEGGYTIRTRASSLAKPRDNRGALSEGTPAVLLHAGISL
jgi:hypothetical protein